MIHIRREVKLAVTAITAVVILVWGINFLKARSLFDNNNIFYAVYERVDGLKISNSVIYRGYTVGQVTAINFIGDRFEKVLVQFSVGKKLQIPANTTAAIQSADLMGSKAVNLIPGDSPVYAESGDTLVSQIELGLMAQLNEKLEPLKRKAENIMVSLDTVLVTVQDIFKEDANGNVRGALRSISRTLENIEEASASLNGLLDKESPRISSILSDVSQITGNLERSNEKIHRSLDNVSALSDSLRAANLKATLATLDGVLVQADSILTRLNHGRGTLGAVLNDGELYYNLKEASANLNRLLEEFRENPKRFVHLSLFDFGGSGKSVVQPYAVAVEESPHPLPLSAPLFTSYPQVKEINRNGVYYYLLGFCKNLKQAEKELERLKEEFPQAFIVKID